MTPDKDLTKRYAAASGDSEPDPHRPRVREEWSACRASSSTASGRWPRSRARRPAVAGGDPRALKRLEVQFRGMGVPEQEIVVTARSGRDGDRVVIDTGAEQAGNGIIRNAEAEIELSLSRPAPAPPRPLPRIKACSASASSGSSSSSVDAYLESGSPVGSKAIAERDERRLERLDGARRARRARAGGLPDPPAHLGRARADRGRLPALRRRWCSPAARSAPKRAGGLELRRMRREVDEAMRETTATLSRINDLLALATAPPPSSAATIHRVEVLRLQPRVVAGRGHRLQRRRRPSASSRSSARSTPASSSGPRASSTSASSGLGLGARMIDDRAAATPSSASASARFLDELARRVRRASRPAADEQLYVDGAARLLSEDHAADLPHLDGLVGALERRATLLARPALARSTSAPCSSASARRTRSRELRSVSVVGANYGLGYRNLGAVGVVGPAADGLREGDRLGPRRGRRALAASSRRCTRARDG